MGKLEELFPNDHFENSERNALLSTIRIPKNIMYLSDKLPRPSYQTMAQQDNVLRNTTKEDVNHLPDIPEQKRPKQKKKSVESTSKILKNKLIKNGEKLVTIEEDKSGENKNTESPKKDLKPQLSLDSDNNNNKNNIKRLAAIQERNKKLSENIIKSSLHYNEVGDDLYIQQLLNKRNPIIRPRRNNIQRIAGIYSGNNADQILSIHKK